LAQIRKMEVKTILSSSSNSPTIHTSSASWSSLERRGDPPLSSCFFSLSLTIICETWKSWCGARCRQRRSSPVGFHWRAAVAVADPLSRIPPNMMPPLPLAPLLLWGFMGRSSLSWVFMAGGTTLYQANQRAGSYVNSALWPTGAMQRVVLHGHPGATVISLRKSEVRRVVIRSGRNKRQCLCASSSLMIGCRRGQMISAGLWPLDRRCCFFGIQVSGSQMKG
jgi:hypothetical protein